MPKNLKKFGSLLGRLRAENNLSIREVCKLVGYDPSNWSKIERGLISPPSEEKTLKLWAKVLKIKGEEIQKFMDDASIAQGMIPSDILNKTEMLELMPAFFQVVRNKKPEKAEIDRLVRLIKSS